MIPLKLSVLLAASFAVFSYGQEARFFRMVGSSAIGFTSVSPDGTVTLTNTGAGGICTIQTTTWIVESGPLWVDWTQIPISNVVTVVKLFDPAPPGGMVLIPAGSFTMGNCMDTNEGPAVELPVHTVYVSAFYLDKFKVTKVLWDSVYAWATNNGYTFNSLVTGKGSNHPAINVRWYDAVKWCNARSEMEGRTPAYYTSAAQTAVYRTGQVDVQSGWVNWDAGYRLPTEAEWERAARGGLSEQRFPWGNTISWSLANYSADPTDYP